MPRVPCSPFVVLAVGLATALVLALPAGRASAQDTEEEALDEARAALRAGDTELAIDILDEARAREDTPAIHYELFVAHEQAGELATAASLLETYLARKDVTLAPGERRDLEGYLADLRARLAPRPSSDDFWADPAIPIVGWALLGTGIAGVLAFAVSAAVALGIEAGVDPVCRRDHSLCRPGERAGIEEAWIAGSIAAATGLVLAGVGAVFLFLAGENERGGSRSLPPDLDPTIQGTFSLAPWVDPTRGGGLAVSGSF